MSDQARQDEDVQLVTDRGFYEFSLLDLLYWTTLTALGIGTFGPGVGLYVTAGVAITQFAVAGWRRGRPAEWGIALSVLVVCLLVSILLPSLQAVRDASRRNSSLNNLKQLALALHNHQDTRGHMPAASTRDSDGRLLHSWRTALLPYIEDQALYDRVDLASAWNDPENGQAAAGQPLWTYENEALFSPRLPAVTSPGWETHYFAITGEETMWPEGGLASLLDVPDGAAETIVLIEACGRGVRWCEPCDLTLEEAIDLLTGKGEGTWIDPGFFYSVRYEGDGCYPRLVAFADGHARAIYPFSDRALARALLTRDGGEEIDLESLSQWQVQPDLKAVEILINWPNVLLTTLYACLAVWPLFRKRSYRRVMRH